MVLDKTMRTLLCIHYISLLSCSPVIEDESFAYEKVDSESSRIDFNTVLSKDQRNALNAWNTLQMSTAEKNRLYSTFASLSQPCYPVDTSFSITQLELALYLKKFVSKYCQSLPEDLQNELVQTSVLAQEDYSVLCCNIEVQSQKDNDGLPMNGTWIMPNILGRRDVILVW
jgi:hypothetical protein